MSSTEDSIKDAMSRAQRLFPSGYWQAYFNGRFLTADTKLSLRHLLSETRKEKK